MPIGVLRQGDQRRCTQAGKTEGETRVCQGRDPVQCSGELSRLTRCVRELRRILALIDNGCLDSR